MGRTESDLKHIFAVQFLKLRSHHLEGCIVAFLSGALEVWNRLTDKYCKFANTLKVLFDQRQVEGNKLEQKDIEKKSKDARELEAHWRC